LVGIITTSSGSSNFTVDRSYATGAVTSDNTTVPPFGDQQGGIGGLIGNTNAINGSATINVTNSHTTGTVDGGMVQ
jgi:hypothetical protein